MIVDKIPKPAEDLYLSKVGYADLPFVTNKSYDYELLCVHDPTNIWIKIKGEDTSEHEQLLKEAFKFYPRDVPINESCRFPKEVVYPGMPVVVKRGKDDSGSYKLVRGEVETYGDWDSTVSMIDEGVTETIPTENVLPISLRVLRVPRIGYKVRLAQIVPQKGAGWPAETKDKVYYTGEKSQTVTFGDYFPQARLYDAVLLIDGISVALKFLHNGWANPQPLPTIKPGGFFPVLNYSPWLGLKMIAFAVRAFVDEADNRLKCVLQMDPELVDEIQTEISRCLEHYGGTYAQKNPLGPVTPGMYVIAKYAGGEYYRGIVQKVVDENLIQIEYVDYKEVGVVPKSDLLACPWSVYDKPEGAVVCTMTDFLYNDFEDVEKFKAMTQDKDVYVVIDVCDPETFGNELLVSLFEPVDFLSGADTPFREILGLKNKPTELTDILRPISIVSQELGGLFLKPEYPDPARFYPGVNPFVCTINSWDSVWIQLEENIPVTEKLSSELDQFYSSNGCNEVLQEEFLSVIKVGEYVATPLKEEDGTECWYRGRVVERETEKGNQIMVHFIDYGNDDLVDAAKVFPLHFYFLKYPILAHEVSFKLKV